MSSRYLQGHRCCMTLLASRWRSGVRPSRLSHLRHAFDQLPQRPVAHLFTNLHATRARGSLIKGKARRWITTSISRRRNNVGGKMVTNTNPLGGKNQILRYARRSSYLGRRSFNPIRNGFTRCQYRGHFLLNIRLLCRIQRRLSLHVYHC